MTDQGHPSLPQEYLPRDMEEALAILEGVILEMIEGTICLPHLPGMGKRRVSSARLANLTIVILTNLRVCSELVCL